jgi:hypothetical protein
VNEILGKKNKKKIKIKSLSRQYKIIVEFKIK